MKTEEIVKQLLEMSFDMDYMDYADSIIEVISNLTHELENIKETGLYDLLENVILINGNKSTPLLNDMIKYEKENQL